MTTSDVTELILPADETQVYIVRSVAVAVALGVNFDLDEVDDVRLAVDEMCAALLARARPAARLVCRFRSAADTIRVVASVNSDIDRPVSRHTLGWQVLTMLTDQAESWTTAGRGSPYEVHIRISRSRRR